MPAFLARRPAVGRRATPAGRSGFWPLAVAGAFLLAMIVVGHTVDVARYLEAGRSWARSLGVLAPVAFVAVYVAATYTATKATGASTPSEPAQLRAASRYRVTSTVWPTTIIASRIAPPTASGHRP